MAAPQDWKPLVLRKDVGGGGPSQQIRESTGVNMKLLETDDESYTPPTITRDMGLQISQARNKLKLSQEQLANKCHIPVSVVREYEQGKGLYNRKYLDPICKLLSIKINKSRK